METLLVVDAKNYDPELKELKRTAVRGVVIRNGKLLVTEDKYGELKLPGGGMEAGETDKETLIREVQEESGYKVKPETIRPFGSVIEIRKSIKEEMIWHQESRLYFCDVFDEIGERKLTPHEIRFEYQTSWYTLDQAIKKNYEMLVRENWNSVKLREYRTFQLIKDYLGKNR